MNESLCNKTYSSITEPSALDYFPFNLYELSSVNKIDLKVVAYVDFAGGYARHGRDLVEYLNNSGLFNIKLEKLSSSIDVDPFTYSYFKHLTKTKIDENNFIELVIGAPGHLMRLKDSKAKYKIGYTMFEGLFLTDEIASMCIFCDELFVPTELDVKRFEKVKVINENIIITKLPLWVDTKVYKHGVVKAKLVNVPENNFVIMFNGSWNKRKGIHEIIECFIREFSSEEPISLVLLSKYCTNPFNDRKRGRKKKDLDKWNILWEYEYILKKSKLESKKNKPHVCILDVPISESIMRNFMKNANVCICASRGESTWLPGLEFASMGITSIQTSWGGHTDYLNETNSWPIQFDGFEECDKELYLGVSDYYRNTEMARLNIKNVQRAMRDAFKNKWSTHRKGINVSRFVRKNYSKKERLEEVKNRIIQIVNNVGEIKDG